MSKKLTDTLDCDGVPDYILDGFKESEDLTDKDIEEVIEEYREDVINENVDSEEDLREALLRYISLKKNDIGEVKMSEEESNNKEKVTLD